MCNNINSRGYSRITMITKAVIVSAIVTWLLILTNIKPQGVKHQEPFLFHTIFLSRFDSPALVNYHLLSSVQCSEAIVSGTAYETAEGSTIEIGCDGDSLTVNGITMVLKKDVVTTNGVIHFIDQVLIPDSGKTHLEHFPLVDQFFFFNHSAEGFFCVHKHVTFM